MNHRKMYVANIEITMGNKRGRIGTLDKQPVGQQTYALLGIP